MAKYILLEDVTDRGAADVQGIRLRPAGWPPSRAPLVQNLAERPGSFTGGTRLNNRN